MINYRYFILLAGIFISTSCAKGQDHLQNERWLDEEKLVAQSTVVLNNELSIVPITNLQELQIASISIGFNYAAMFDSLLNKYNKVSSLNGDPYRANGALNDLIDDVKFYNTLIFEVSDIAIADPKVINFILETEKKRKVIVAFFGSSNNLTVLGQIKSPIIWCDKNSVESASFVAQAIFGGVGIDQVLKENYTSKFVSGYGSTYKKMRLTYTVPEEVGINITNLLQIDAIAAEAIAQKATPGAVVMVIKDGNVIFNKAYGNFGYDINRPVKADDIYDLASITKISATTPAVMRLVENGVINLDSTLKVYLGKARNTDKKDIAVREVMLHQAGFTPYIPFYERLKPSDFSIDSSSAFPVKVADNYYLRKNYYREIMWPQMLKSKLISRGRYVYSDLSMYFMKEIIEGQVHKSLDQYVKDEFYIPLGMQTAGFNPRNRFDKDRIVPTENDTYFRKTVLQGYVHDQGAAMAGGVSGHAGLFASTNDLAILFQMILNGGTYGGVSYFKPETIRQFTSKQSTVSRRGLGFDGWDPVVSKRYPSEFASPQTYGHTGYTGTCIWVDPQFNLIYVFLSNRTYPKVTDKLSQLNIRSRIQDVIYQAIKKTEN